MLSDVIRWLRCPQCGSALADGGGTTMLRCPVGHAFDVARQGYVSLLPPGWRAPAGDTAAMVAARADFLAAGHYDPLAGEVAGAVAAAIGAAEAPVPGCVADIGAGTGYYLAAALDGLPAGRAGLALDVSKFAARRAARAHPRIGAVVADVRGRLPVADGAAAVALSIFAPRPGAELSRILAPGGRLLVVAPGQDHLAELAGPLRLLSVDPRKDERLASRLGPFFELTGQHRHRFGITLDHDAIAAVVAMGPSAWHTGAAVMAERIAGLPGTVPATVSVTVSAYRRAAGDTGG